MLPSKGRAPPLGASAAADANSSASATPAGKRPRPSQDVDDDDYRPPSGGSSDNEENGESPSEDCPQRPGKQKRPGGVQTPAEGIQRTTKSAVSSGSLAEMLDSGRSKKPRTTAHPSLLSAAYIPLSCDGPAQEDPGAAEAYRARVRALPSADHGTEAPVRVTIRKRLTEALQAHGSGKHPEEVQANIIAAEVEEALFTSSGSIVNDGYKQKFRRLEFNIKDPKNGALRHSVLCAHTTARQLVAMKPDELANPVLKEEYRKIAEYKAQEKLADTDTRVTSDAWKCGRCGARRCTYTEIQVRRADEPMTTFVQCAVCNNRWRC